MMSNHYKWIRWIVILLCLTGLILIINETIKAANSKQYENVLKERVPGIQAIALKQGHLHIDAESNKSLNRYVKNVGGSLTIYDTDGQAVYSTRRHPHQLKAPKKLPLYQNSHGAFTIIEPMIQQKKTTGFIKMEGELPRVKGLLIFYVILFIAGILLVLLYDRLVRKFSRSIREAASMAEDLSQGRYQKRASEYIEDSDVSRLNYSLNVLARSLEKIAKSYLTQQDRLKTLIENIGSGLIFIDGNGRISLVNKTYRETFQAPTENWLNQTYQDVIPHSEVTLLITETFKSGTALTKQLKLPIRIERKHFDVSCAPILDQNERLRGIVVVFHDITELKKLEKMRKDFVANVSHELKTPVTSVIGFTETLLDGAMEEPELQDKFLNIILSESKRLQTLISELLELSKIEQEHFEIKWEHVQMTELLDDTIMVLTEKAGEKGITLTDSTKEAGIALGDPQRIRQIMINLITNAISYTSAGGKIQTEIKNMGDGVKLIVSDTGIGIEPNQIPRIFERFYRVDKARSRNLGGTGLGLAIVKHLVEAHGGRIDVASKPGEGTTFEITFKKPIA
ncbi:PAS/PAC sensor signal transduction histidine kinase [Scopulibacillus darangshiensis]|uniref:histidine kinase n=1 Tax=Scopulibacillus darangshiensis TaxID=442528 RepID=A0A4R2PCG1_9BACL|nr:ATP-binding protein [Scopulibacillus darangshiensis]TCP32098.1 PAS/PAC sensor signal transduction histidine kinase [Scopulibacillus darangshiensis]